MKQNYVSQHYSPEQWAQVDEALASLVRTLDPLLIALSADQRQQAVKMGDGSEPFCRKALEVIRANPTLVPGNFDVAEFARDLETHDALNLRLNHLSRLLERAQHTEMAVGSDAMVSALEGYRYLKTSGKHEGVEALSKLLGKRFEGNGQRQEEPEPQAQ